jgi:hypothetical protein
VSRLPLCIVLSALVACGDPGSDAVFTSALPGGTQPTAAAQRDSAGAVRRPQRTLDIRVWRGQYRRTNDGGLFQPCGGGVVYEIAGPGDVRARLRDYFRFNARWPGVPLYAVLRGAIRTDTIKGTERAAPGTSAIVTRFWTVNVDTIETWDNQCRVPR